MYSRQYVLPYWLHCMEYYSGCRLNSDPSFLTYRYIPHSPAPHNRQGCPFNNHFYTGEMTRPAIRYPRMAGAEPMAGVL